jgi:hypothetical protein
MDLREFKRLAGLRDDRKLVEARPKQWSFAVMVQYNADNDRGETSEPRIANVHRSEAAAKKEVGRLTTSKTMNAQRKVWVLPRAEAEKLETG